MKTLVERLTATDEGMRLFQQGRIEFDVTELVSRLMKEQRISRGTLGKRIGRSKGFITQFLMCSVDIDIKLLADIMWALGKSVYVGVGPLSIHCVKMDIKEDAQHE
jgi:hypothetical protein